MTLVIKMGWYGEYERNRQNFVDKIIDGFNCEVLDISDKYDHIWVLYNNKNIKSVMCYLIEKDSEGYYMYKPISCESGPVYRDIPKEWLNKITSVEDRLKLNPKDNTEYFSEWLDEVREFYSGKEVDIGE